MTGAQFVDDLCTFTFTSAHHVLPSIPFLLRSSGEAARNFPLSSENKSHFNAESAEVATAAVSRQGQQQEQDGQA